MSASIANTQAKPKLTAAERTQKLLAFKRGHSHNFTLVAVPSKPVHRAVGAMRTSA